MFHALLAAVLLRTGQINYTTHAVPLSTAVAEMAKQAGKKLMVGNDLAKEPVILRLKEVEPQAAMDRIAEVFGAEWVSSREGQTLTRTPEATKRLLEARKTRIAAALVKGLEPLRKLPKLDEAAAGQIVREYVNLLKTEEQNQYLNSNAKRTELSNRTADARLLVDIILAIGPENLALLPSGRTVFAVDPTPMERPIPLGPERLERYVAEHNLLADQMAHSDLRDLHDGMIFTGIQQANSRVESTPVRALVEVDSAPSHGLFFYLHVYDSQGKAVAEGQWTFGGSLAEEWIAIKPRLLLESAKKPTIKLPPALVALGKRSIAGRSSKPTEPPSAEALQMLLHPDQSDPLDLGFSQLVLGIGDQDDVNVVATANDGVFGSALRATADGEYKPDYVCALLTNLQRENFERRDGWLLATPSDPLYATQIRIDRPSLATFMQTTQQAGYSSLEAWAELALANPEDDCSSIAMQYRNVWRAQNAMYDYGFWAAYRLYGLLSQSQIEALTKGQTLPYGSLEADQRECVNKIVYEWGGLVPTETSKFDPNAARNELDRSIRSRPTEAMPDGVPDTFRIGMSDELQERFYISTLYGGFNQKDRPVDLDSVAGLIAQNQRADLFPPDSVPTLTGLRYGQERTVVFRGQIDPSLTAEVRLKEERKPAGEAIPIENLKDALPPPIWERLSHKVDEMLANYKQHQAEIRTSIRAPKPPPPPPPFVMR